MLNKNNSKTKRDATDRADMMTKEHKQVLEALAHQINEMKRKIDVGDASIEDWVQLTVTKLTEQLNDQIAWATE